MKKSIKQIFAVVLVGCTLTAALTACKKDIKVPPAQTASNSPGTSSAVKALGDSSGSSSAQQAVGPLLLLVNKTNPVPEDYRPAFVSIPIKYFVSSSKDYEDHFVNDAAGYLVKMMDDAKKDGISLCVVSGYRSKEDQKVDFDGGVNRYLKLGYSQSSAEEREAAAVALPGYSEHQTGLAVDLDYNGIMNLEPSFDQTPAFAWLISNCSDYGFILRYPKDKVGITEYEYEPWHYRFVGVDNAKKIMAGGLCLEEYLEPSASK